MPSIEIETVTGRGGGGGAKGAEGFKSSYAMKAIFDRETLKMLAEMGIYTPENRQRVVFSMEELKVLGYTGLTTGGPMQYFNRILNTMKVPFEAGTVDVEGVKKVKIIRYGNEYDFKRYSTTEAGKPAYRTEVVDGKEVTTQVGIVDHEDAPPGLVQAIEEQLAEIAEDELMQDIILKLGLDKKMAELNLIDVQEEEEVEETK